MPRTGRGPAVSNNDIVLGFDEEKCQSLEIQIRRVNEVEHGLLLSLTGYLDVYYNPCFLRRVTKAIDAGYTRLIFDMHGYRDIGEPGIGVFTAFLKAVKPRGGDITFFSIQPQFYEAFQLLGFSQFFNIRDTLDEATVFFAPAGKPPEFPIVFRCGTCGTILAVDPPGQVFLG
jgi:anti-sigma B factor antagonist